MITVNINRVNVPVTTGGKTGRQGPRRSAGVPGRGGRPVRELCSGREDGDSNGLPLSPLSGSWWEVRFTKQAGLLGSGEQELPVSLLQRKVHAGEAGWPLRVPVSQQTRTLENTRWIDHSRIFGEVRERLYVFTECPWLQL